LLSAIITKLTGKPAEDYATEKLFGPLELPAFGFTHSRRF